MRARTPGIVLLVAAAQGIVMGLPRRGEAATHVSGSSFAEDAATSRPEDESNLFQTGVNLDVVPATKKNLKANLNMRFNYVRSDEDELTDFSPFGNLGLDLAGESYSLNLQQSRHATLGTTTQLTETTVSRASFSFVPKALPHLSASLSRTESEIGSSPASTTETGSVSADYRYKWAQVRAGYSADRRDSGVQPSNESSSLFVGLGGSYEILPATVLRGDVDLNRFQAKSAGGAESSTDTRVLRLNADSRPLPWLGFTGNLSRSATDFESGTSPLSDTTAQLADVTTTLFPHPSLQLGATVGNRRFNDVQAVRSVDFTTLSALFSREIRERILVGATASRSFESDPGQGRNITDNLGASAAANLTSRIGLRLNASVSRSEDRTFVSSQTFSASGTLADRDRLDRDSGGLPPGFTFFDTVNNDLYTKNSSAIGDWSLTSHIDLVVGSFSANRSIQVNAIPTERMNLSLSYASNASADNLVALRRVGNQSLNGSFSYLATRRSNLGLSGTASVPKSGNTAYSATGSYSYRFVRGHQMSLTYGRQVAAARRIDSLSATLRLSLRKRTSLDLTYLATQLFQEKQTHFTRVRVSHSF